MKEFKLKYWDNKTPIVHEYNMEFRNATEAYRYIKNKQCTAISVKAIAVLPITFKYRKIL